MTFALFLFGCGLTVLAMGVAAFGLWEWRRRKHGLAPE